MIVNILTNYAVNKGQIRVLGGTQLRPNVHIDDMCAVYLLALALPGEQIDGGIYNVGCENHTVMQLAEMVRAEVGPKVTLNVEPTNDPRSYHISSAKVLKNLGFRTERRIEDAVRDLVGAFADGRLPNSFDDPRYYNIRVMQDINLR